MEKIFNESNFAAEVLGSERPVLVDFYANWCGPCKMMAPVVEQLAEAYADTVTVGILNVDENMGVALEYGVASIPTLILFVKGKEAGRLIGVQSSADVESLLENRS